MNQQENPPEAITEREPSMPDKRSIFGLPHSTSSSARIGFWILAVCILLFSIALPVIVRGLIFDRQYNLDENAHWRAIEALKNNEDERARIETQKAIETTIETRYEGLITEPLVTPAYNELADLLLKKGWAEQGRAVALKSISFFHRMPRALEDLSPWHLLLEEYYSAGDFPRFFQVFEIMAAHSALSTSIFYDRDKDFYRSVGRLYQNYATMRQEQYNFSPALSKSRFQELTHYVSLSNSAPHPDMRIAVDTLVILASLADNDVAGAARVSTALLSALPERLEPRALEALVQRGTDAFAFTRSLDPQQWETIGFQKMSSVATEFFPPGEIKTSSDGIVTFQKNGAGEVQVELSRGASEIYLVASGKSYLDIYPILLVSVDGGEAFPLHIDREKPEIYRIPHPLEPGEHTIRFEFVNDYAGTINTTKFDRNVNFFRLVFQSAVGQ